MDTLLTLAEVAIAMAGFSAVVVIFKKRDTNTWLKLDADRFHGMVLHAMLAALFCFLPFLLIEFAEAENAPLRWSSALLAIATAVQLVVAVRLETSGKPWIKVYLAGVGSIVCVLLGANAASAFTGYELAVYLVGIFWYVMQAAILFVMLIWIPASQIER